MSTWGSMPIDVKEDYVPPEVWKWEFPDTESINRPTAGARFERPLPVGEHDLQLYSLATPNGQKVTILLEELLEAGHKNAEYDAWLIRIGEKDQFGSGFVEVNPNSKIPAMVDKSAGDLKIFESGSILLYLADKFGAFIPPTTDMAKRTACMNWLFWQVGSGPYVGGGFGHFFRYANVKMRYPIDRFTMETKRQLDVLDKHLAENKYMVGDDYTIADMAILPWYGGLVLDQVYEGAAAFLNVEEEYPNVIRWANELFQRPAVKRGRIVNRTTGSKSKQLHERHAASDFETKTQDKIEASSS